MNLEVAALLGSSITPERIQEVIRQLNGIRHIRSRALDALGLGEGEDFREYNGILESDIGAVVHHLKQALGFDGNNDFSKLIAAKVNVFRVGDSVTPWSRVQEAIAKERTDEYVKRMLGRAPKNTMG